MERESTNAVTCLTLLLRRHVSCASTLFSLFLDLVVVSAVAACTDRPMSTLTIWRNKKKHTERRYLRFNINIFPHLNLIWLIQWAEENKKTLAFSTSRNLSRIFCVIEAFLCKTWKIIRFSSSLSFFSHMKN